MIHRLKIAFLVAALAAGLLAACSQEAEIPKPVKMTREANGFYCRMIVIDHPGPKAQVHEKDRDKPIWFSSVRDALAYLRLPGEAQRVTAVYVHDMGRAESWAKPQNDGIWIKAETALYVIGSARRGGMGAKEAVPFETQETALRFATRYGGRIVTYDEIPSAYILGDDGEHNTGGSRTKPPAQ